MGKMKSSHRKWIAALCGAAMTFSVLTACGPQGGGSQAAQGEGEAEGPVSIQMFAGLFSELPDMNDEYWTGWQEMTNSKLDIEWVPSGDLNTKLDLLLASGQLPEVVSTTDFTRPTLISAIKNGAFWDLTPFLGDLSEYPNLKENLADDALKYLSVDGKIYALPRSRSRVDGGLKIREDWLKELNIDVPTTMEEYKDALAAIVKAKPGTVGHLFVDNPTAAMQAGFGVYNPTYDDAGGLINPRLTPQYVEMVGFFRELYAEGLMSKEYAVMKETQAEELFKTNRAASYGRPIWWDDEWEKAMRKSGEEDAKILNLHLKGPDGDDAVALETGVSGGFYISKKVPEEKVKQLLAYFEQTASQELTDYAYYGKEGVHHTVEDGQKVLTEQGVKEVNTTSKGAGVLAYAKWGKVISASASKAFNDAKIAEVEVFDEIGKIDPYRVVTVESWINAWPQHDTEYKSMMTKAIVGQISLEDFDTYVAGLREQPALKQAFLDMAAAYKQFQES